MPDAHESCRNAPDQPHNCSRFIVYSKECAKAQGAFEIFARKFTELVPLNDRLRLSKAKGTVKHAMDYERKAGVLKVLRWRYRFFKGTGGSVRMWGPDPDETDQIQGLHEFFLYLNNRVVVLQQPDSRFLKPSAGRRPVAPEDRIDLVVGNVLHREARAASAENRQQSRKPEITVTPLVDEPPSVAPQSIRFLPRSAWTMIFGSLRRWFQLGTC